jgi:predicted HAD superfamily phosphohydrolase YqeG
MEEMSRIVDIEVEFLRIKLNPLILDLENNVIRTGSASVATASREYLEAVKEYNYGFSSNVDRFKREREAHDRLQIAVGEALEAGPFTDYEL